MHGVHRLRMSQGAHCSAWLIPYSNTIAHVSITIVYAIYVQMFVHIATASYVELCDHFAFPWAFLFRYVSVCVCVQFFIICTENILIVNAFLLV